MSDDRGQFGGGIALSDPEIEYYNCEDCRLSELEPAEAELHKRAAEHTVVPVYQ